MRVLLLLLLCVWLSPSVARSAEGETEQVMTIESEWRVTVDGETKTWKPFEEGTDKAWQAYLNGDYLTAVPAFRKLAEMGHPVAQWLMGVIYYQGQGVPMDKARSFDWFRRASEQGYFRAFAPLASMYQKGEGTSADSGLAYAWYNIAISRLPESRERNDLMKLRELLAAGMTPAQIEAAQKRANQFVPTPVIPPDPEDLPEE